MNRVVDTSKQSETNSSQPSSLPGGAGSKEIVSRWSNAVKKELAKIATAFTNVATAKTEKLTSFADQVEMIDTHVLVKNEVYRDHPVDVVEIGVSESEIASATIRIEPVEFIQRLREALFLEGNQNEHSVHFKLYGINRDGEHLVTRQRLTARGTRRGNQVISNAVADATWELPANKSKNGTPRLLGFSMPKLVQKELTGEQSKIMEDVTNAVLGRNASWREQLQLGMNTWARRIDRSLKPDFLGYHGLAIRDVDGDNLEDIYLCQPGGLPNLLFQQQPDGKLRDISKTAGVDWLDNSTGALLVDLDNDGDADLALATQQAFLLMENDGSGKFSLRSRYSNIGLGYSPTAADYDLDGDLDLLVLRYGGDGTEVGDFPTPHPFHNARNGGANVFLENKGGFQFVDVTDAKGLGVENFRFSFAASWEDYDNDGDPDLYIANDFGPNSLFRNDDGKFIDASAESGTQDWGFGMSAAWADYDRDGNMDLYVSSMFSGAGSQVIPQSDFNLAMPEETRRKYLKMVRGNSLLRNVGQGRFLDVTNPSAEGFGGWAWGAKFADFNNDGWQDLYVANGYISQPDKDDL